MIVQDLEPLIAGPVVVATVSQSQEFENFAAIPSEWLEHVVVRLQARGDRLVIAVRDPQSTQVLETHGYEFEAGF